MKHEYNPQKHHRRSIRLPDYDSAQSGTYFITICAWQREAIFGTIENGIMHLSPIGRILEKEWKRLVYSFANIRLDAVVIMPNHVHGIITILESTSSVRATHPLPTIDLYGDNLLPADTPSCPSGSPLPYDGIPVRATHPSPANLPSGNNPLPANAPSGPDGSPLHYDIGGVARTRWPDTGIIRRDHWTIQVTRHKTDLVFTGVQSHAHLAAELFRAYHS